MIPECTGAGGMRTRPGVAARALRRAGLVSAALLTTAVPLTPQVDQTATLRGVIASAATGEPLARARVTHLATRRGALTDSAGGFTVPGLPAGPADVEVGAEGYGSDVARIPLEAGRVTDIVLLMSPDVVRVAELHVTIEQERWTKLTGFEERRERGIGYFLTREDIERRGAQVPSDALRQVPGVRVDAFGTGGARIRVTRGDIGGGMDCPPLIYLDGIYTPGLHLDEINVEDVLAIEIYRGPSETPPEFARRQAHCGVIVVWTQDGTRG